MFEHLHDKEQIVKLTLFSLLLATGSIFAFVGTTGRENLLCTVKHHTFIQSVYKRAVKFDQFLKCLFCLILKVCFRWRVTLISAASQSEFRNSFVSCKVDSA